MALTEKDIIGLVSVPDKVVSIIDETIEGIEIKNGQYKAKFVTLSKSVVEGLVHIENENVSICLILEDCNFKDRVIFKNLKGQGYDSVFNPDSQSLVFRNCTFSKSVQFGGKNTEFERHVLFEGCTFKEGIEIDGLKITDESLTFRKCSIEKKLDIFNVEAKQDVSLASNTVNTFTRFENITCSFFTILEENIFSDRLHIQSSVFDQGIVFNDGTFKREVDVTLIRTGRTGLQVHGSTFEKAFYVAFHSGKVKPENGIYSIYLKEGKFLNGIYVVGKNDLFANEPIVEQIMIELSAELKGDVVFRDLHVGILSFSGFNSTANLLFQNLFINQIKIKGLINDAGLVFSGIKASHIKWYRNGESKLERDNSLFIDDCNFGKTQFFQTDFSSFNKVVFHNNILTDISYSLVRWFTPNQLDAGEESVSFKLYNEAKKSKDKLRIHNAMLSVVADYRSKQEIYRQLKFASQKQGDLPQTLEFQRWEMHYYRKIVNLRKPKNWNEVIILWSNQSNDFGQNWLKALGLLLLFSFVSYLPIGFLISDRLDYATFASSFSDIGVTLQVIFSDNIKNWIVILNPVHRINDFDDNINKYSSWLYFWDILSRVAVSYFIFQMISAFRKFNK